MTKTAARARTEIPPIVLRAYPALDMDEDRFLEFCQQNRDLRIERNAEGDLEVMPPTGWTTGDRNSEINFQLRLWNRQGNSGVVTDSSTGFVLANGAVRSPDAAWVRRESLADLTPEQKQGFLPLCPDFVIELRSHTDRLTTIEAKMREYVENGARLGCLIDPELKQVHVYRTGKEPERLDGVNEVSGDPALPGFALDLRRIWNPGL